MNTRQLTLLFLLLGSMLRLHAQTEAGLYQWPIEGAEVGEGILCRPQEYVDNEHNFDALFIGAELGANVVSPCDGVITYVTMVHRRSLTSISSYGVRKGPFAEAMEYHREDMKKNGNDVKYLSYMLLIKSKDGRTVEISGLKTDTLFVSGQTVKKGEVLGEIHYCYKKIHQPCICLSVSKGGEV